MAKNDAQIHKIDNRLDLDRLERNAHLTLTTGAGEAVWVYDFHVLESSGKGREYPLGVLIATPPASNTRSELEVALVGTAAETTRTQNPVQTQEKALTISWGFIHVGGFLVARAFSESELIIIGQPDHPVSTINQAG